jgi:hypothetical protein
VHVFVDALHASLEVVQKLAPALSPPIAPAQHGCPSPPHPPQLPLLHVPTAPHAPDIRQTPATQQRLPPHEELWQHG